MSNITGIIITAAHRTDWVRDATEPSARHRRDALRFRREERRRRRQRPGR